MLAIVGPTASGKSGIAVEMAKEIGGTVINGDPFQAFKDIPIGTGQPRPDEQRGVPHVGYGALPLDYTLNPASFGALVREWLCAAEKTGNPPVLVTGSGLYLRGIWNQLDPLPSVPEKIVQKTRRLSRQLGPPTLHRYLRAVDPDRASRLHPNDGSRIQRALALHLATGRPPSAFLTAPDCSVPQTWRVLLVLPQREAMRERVAKRVKSMIDAGWQREAQEIERAGLAHHLRRLRPLGYDVWLGDGAATQAPSGGLDPEMAEQRIAQATQAYAKRQATWFRNQLPGLPRLDPDAGEDDFVRWTLGFIP
jgi:tRNA dimethylallyltransferase